MIQPFKKIYVLSLVRARSKKVFIKALMAAGSCYAAILPTRGFTINALEWIAFVIVFIIAGMIGANWQRINFNLPAWWKSQILTNNRCNSNA